MKWVIRVLLVVVIVPCIILTLSSSTAWFSTPYFIISFLKWIGWILIFMSVVFFGLATEEILTQPNEEKSKGVLANPSSRYAVLAILCGIMGVIAQVQLYVTGNISTAFQKEALELLNDTTSQQKEALELLKEILKYVKP